MAKQAVVQERFSCDEVQQASLCDPARNIPLYFPTKGAVNILAAYQDACSLIFHGMLQYVLQMQYGKACIWKL